MPSLFDFSIIIFILTYRQRKNVHSTLSRLEVRLETHA